MVATDGNVSVRIEDGFYATRRILRMKPVENGFVHHLLWEDDRLRFLDQTLLPAEVKYVETSNFSVVCNAVRRLAIRGAPAIGIAAGYALALGAAGIKSTDLAAFLEKLEGIRREIASCRPTAVNLFWALNRMMERVDGVSSVAKAVERLTDEAERIHSEDIEICRTLGVLGSELLPMEGGVMTHCNAGGLATGGYGTALGVIHAAFSALLKAGNAGRFKVIVNETRPLFQGARLTAWELREARIPFVLITDNMAGKLFADNLVRCVIVGADRIASNGDTANKIGTYGLAVLADYHNVPFYVAAPTSTIDPQIESGLQIPVEERNPEEVTHPLGFRAAPEGTQAWNPAFDVTPSHLISAIITEKGIVRAPFGETIQEIT